MKSSPAPAAAPPLPIPPSDTIVKVSIIDTSGRIGNIQSQLFMDHDLNRFGFEQLPVLPAFSFLIEHAGSGDKLLFDLGVQKDLEAMPAITKKLIAKWDVKVPKSVDEILAEHSVDTKSVTNIIFSHRHFDHTGDASLFPHSTGLVGGPGFKKFIGAGYPAEEDSPFLSSALEGRKYFEIDFANDKRATKVGKWRAVDWFSDGSFYLLQSPGHTNDHMCGFARTKLAKDSETGQDEFILMGGDIAHHGGEYKPTKFSPIPDSIEPDPRQQRQGLQSGVCPGEFFAERNTLYEDGSDDRWTKPFMKPSVAISENHNEAIESLGVLEEFDAYDNIFVIFAHDDSLLDLINLFPKPANDWKQNGWKKDGFWGFLKDISK